jgi:hypothetical protein
LIVVVPAADPPAFALIVRLVVALCVPAAEFLRINRHVDHAEEDEPSDRRE